MLHVHNGDSTANTARQASLPGEHFAWRESLITGPTIADLPTDEWQAMRAQHLSVSYGVEFEQCRKELVAQEEKLRSAASSHEEIVLWFEHDLFCQVHLVYLLDWFSSLNSVDTKLSLICIGEFPGKENFRGLGELSADELSSLFRARREVIPEQLTLATAAWRAYCSDDPTAIETFLLTKTAALPFLDAALLAHLRRFPSTANGLGHIENRALQFIAEGMQDFARLFDHFSRAESIYGFGDAQLWLVLRQLCDGPAPLVSVENFESNSWRRQLLKPELTQQARFRITAAGEATLAYEADFVILNGIDEWLGGVHLHDPESLWRWDESTRRLQYSSGPAVSEFGY
jgi:hypothetical protein